MSERFLYLLPTSGMIRYASTRGGPRDIPLERALLEGLAPDGGLYQPQSIPPIPPARWAELRRTRDEIDPDLLRHAVARTLLDLWFGGEVDPAALARIAREANPFPFTIRRVGPVEVLELFHGPTMAFKDVAAAHLARLMGYFLRRRGERALLLVATSGDTGGAIAHGFAGAPEIDVVILFPRGRVSRLQEEQLTRVAPNVTPVEVEGDFDDCQRLVKQAFVDPALSALRLASANSINIARLIPQAIYYLYAALVLENGALEVTVPSGNFGNLTAGLLATAMGAPIARLLAATNANDTAPRYFRSGRYEPRPTVRTLSTAMDIGDPSNFERVIALLGDGSAAVARARLGAVAIDDATTVETIRRVHAEHGYLLCPHSAVGWAAIERAGRADHRPLLVATASPLKFAAEISRATGIPVDDSHEIARLRERPARRRRIPARRETLYPLLHEIAREGRSTA